MSKVIKKIAIPTKYGIILDTFCGIYYYMRRKKRYKHATIGKKKYYFYKIIWEDPCGDAGHADIDEMKKLKPAIMISQAYIFAKDKKHVWTFSSYDSDAAVFSDRNCFPRSIILKMERITL